METTKSHTAIRAVHGGSNAATNRCLTCTRRTYKTQNLRLTADSTLLLSFHYSKIFNNSIFNLVYTIVIGIKYTTCSFKVITFRNDLVPRKVQQHFKIVKLHRIVW